MGPQNLGPAQLQLMLSESIRAGRYANGVDITRYRDETLIDFQLVHPARGHGDVVARVVVSNDFLAELATNLNQLVQQAAKQPATNETPATRQIGFKSTNPELKA